MKSILVCNIQENKVRPQVANEEHKILLGISIMLLLAGNLALKYVGHTFYKESYLNLMGPGFWLIISNALFISIILILNKQAGGWTWSKLGLSKPNSWWRFGLVTLGIMGAVFFLAKVLQPIFMEFSAPADISHLMVLNQNLPALILILLLTLVISTFLEEVVFRGFLINTLDILLGRNHWSPWIAVILSSIAFGFMHAWQGLGGILTTTVLGLIFGSAFIINGRRLWSIMLVKFLINVMTIIAIYTM